MGSVAGKSSSNGNSFTRASLHAGSWYSDDSDSLHNVLEDFLQQAKASSLLLTTRASTTTCGSSLRGLIVPHAGYEYSGPTAGFAYQALLDELSKGHSTIRRILVLHPSHHVYLNGCAVSGASALETPIGNLLVDHDLRAEILSLSGAPFSVMKKMEDEREHSGEMQYPYLAKILNKTNRTDIKVLPVMCGALSPSKEQCYGEALRAIIGRPDVCTVISSDFCHWGSRFSFTPRPQTNDSMPFHEFIEKMDRRGMDLIQMKEPGAFASYLKETRNTICGRHAISVWLNAVAVSNDASSLKVDFIRYAQSSTVKSLSDSSVSYAAAKVTI